MYQEYEDYIKNQKFTLIVLWASFLFSILMFAFVSTILAKQGSDSEPISIEMVWAFLALQVLSILVLFSLRSKFFFSVDSFRKAIRRAKLPSLEGARQRPAGESSVSWDVARLSNEQLAYLYCLPSIQLGSMVSFAVIEFGAILGIVVVSMRGRVDEAAVFFAVAFVAMALIYPRLGPCEDRIREAQFTQGGLG